MMNMIKIQGELKAPKSQFNKFGKYYYRSCEDIVEAAKPVLKKYDCYLNISDEVVMVGDRIYVKATASVYNDSGIVAQSFGFARESETKKGMDESQITGAASSYARKYALNGLFAIDDTKDADTDEHANQAKNAPDNTPRISEQQLKELVDLVAATETDLPKFCAYLKVNELEDLYSCNFEVAKAALMKKVKK